MNAKRNCRLTRTRKGVTLMELIVALTVTAFMAAIGTATFTSIIDNRHILREATAATERSSALRETLRQWLVGAQVQVTRGGVPTGAQSRNVSTTNIRVTQNGAESVTAAALTEEEIVFTTTAPNPTNAPNARMRIFVDEDDNTPEFGLTLEYQVNPQSPLQRRMLDSTVKSMAVEYLDRRTGRWYPSKEAGTINAKAMRLTLVAAEGDSVPALMQVPLTMMLGSFVTVTYNNTAVR